MIALIVLGPVVALLVVAYGLRALDAWRARRLRP